MGKNERQAYLKAIRMRYQRARKKVKDGESGDSLLNGVLV